MLDGMGRSTISGNESTLLIGLGSQLSVPHVDDSHGGLVSHHQRTSKNGNEPPNDEEVSRGDVDSEGPTVLKSTILTTASTPRSLQRTSRPAGTPGRVVTDIPKNTEKVNDKEGEGEERRRRRSTEEIEEAEGENKTLETPAIYSDEDANDAAADDDDDDVSIRPLTPRSTTSLSTPDEPFPLQATTYEEERREDRKESTTDPAAWCHAHIWEHLWRKQAVPAHIKNRHLSLESDTIQNK